MNSLSNHFQNNIFFCDAILGNFTIPWGPWFIFIISGILLFYFSWIIFLRWSMFGLTGKFLLEDIFFKLLCDTLESFSYSFMFFKVTNFFVDFDSGSCLWSNFNIFGQRIVSSNYISPYSHVYISLKISLRRISFAEGRLCIFTWRQLLIKSDNFFEYVAGTGS